MIFAALTLSQYFWMIAFIPFILIGIRRGKRIMKETKEGKRQGVRESRTIFDWMFYNRVDDL